MHEIIPLIPDAEQNKIHKVSIKKCQFLETSCLKLFVIARNLFSVGLRTLLNSVSSMWWRLSFFVPKDVSDIFFGMLVSFCQT